MFAKSFFAATFFAGRYFPPVEDGAPPDPEGDTAAPSIMMLRMSRMMSR